MKRLKLWWPVFFWMAVIFMFSNTPDLKTGLSYDFFLRKCAHVSEYFILTLLLYRAIRATFAFSRLGLCIAPAVVAVFYAVSDEIHQSFIPGRVCSDRDFLIDCIGVVGFYIMLQALRKRGSVLA